MTKKLANPENRDSEKEPQEATNQSEDEKLGIYTPSVEEQHAQEMEPNEIVGRAAVILAKHYNMPFVWHMKSKERVPIEKALEIIREKPGYIYFDMQAFQDIVLKEEPPTPIQKPKKMEPKPQPLPEPPTTANPFDDLFAPDTAGSASWGSTLSSPGQQVYVHPSGIVRLEFDGPVRIQRGKSGNTRVIRIQRLQPAIPKAPEPKKVDNIDESDF